MCLLSEMLLTRTVTLTAQYNVLVVIVINVVIAIHTMSEIMLCHYFLLRIWIYQRLFNLVMRLMLFIPIISMPRWAPFDEINLKPCSSFELATACVSKKAK